MSRLLGTVPGLAAILLIVVIGMPTKAATLGLQYLLIQCNNSASMNRLTAFFDRTPPNERPNQIEVAVAPFLDDRCQIAPDRNRFQNIVTLVKTLRSLGIRTRLTIHLADTHDSSPGRDLASRMLKLWNSVLSAENFLNDRDLQFHISPSLEDGYSKDEFLAALDRVVGGLKPAEVKTLVEQRRFFFRRNPQHLDSKHVDVKVVTHRVFRRDSSEIAVPIFYESHGPAPKAGYAIWSNDGYLAYSHPDEHHKHHGWEPLNEHEQFPIRTFLVRAQSASVVLLWRPAYNLFDVKTVNGERLYSRTGTRVDSRTGNYDQREEETMAKFF